MVHVPQSFTVARAAAASVECSWIVSSGSRTSHIVVDCHGRWSAGVGCWAAAALPECSRGAKTRLALTQQVQWDAAYSKCLLPGVPECAAYSGCWHASGWRQHGGAFKSHAMPATHTCTSHAAVLLQNMNSKACRAAAVYSITFATAAWPSASTLPGCTVFNTAPLAAAQTPPPSLPTRSLHLSLLKLHLFISHSLS